MPHIKWNTPSKGDGNSLKTFASNVKSTGDEDGIIEFIDAKMGIRHGWCVEFRAWDGILGNKTWALLNEKGWDGVLIEADDVKFKKLLENYSSRPNVQTICVQQRTTIP